MNPSDNIERAVEQLNITTRPQTDRHILDDAFAALEKAVHRKSTDIKFAAQRRTLVIRVSQIAAVAAVIIVFFALFYNSTAANIKFSDIYQALGAVENICITTFEPPDNEPVRIEWVSQALNIDMFRIGEQLVLWDIENKAEITKNVSAGSVRTQRLSPEMLTKVKQSTSQRFGLVPFSSLSGLSGALWSRVENSQAEPDMSGTDIYDLIWPEEDPASGSQKFRKWRIYLDRDTKLPKRANWYTKLQSEQEYKLESFSVITYPSRNRLQVLVRSTFPQTATQPREPEYIGTPPPD